MLPMKLYIAEKPSLARAIAEVLPKPQRKGDGCIHLPNGDCVSWCIGHLLEQAPPDAYSSEGCDYKKWRMQDLPIIPLTWQLKAKPSGKKQLAVLRKLIKQADRIVHAGDPDREGQLLVDEVIDFFNVPKEKRARMQRCLISDLNPVAVTRALANMPANSDYIPLSQSALARSRADWLYGINLTRALTLQGNKAGFHSILSVGRVQTPLLGLVARRDEAIEKFVSKPFYQLLATIKLDEQRRFIAKWQPSKACQQWQDEQGRVLYLPLIENVAARIINQPALIKSVQQHKKKQTAPLPYSLSSLQIDAAKRFGMSAQKVLDVCQSLYERHKLLTYPRSDNRYLPKEHLNQRGEVLAAIAQYGDELASNVKQCDQSLRSKAWNDKKVAAHHAIIPTAKSPANIHLNADEKNIYQHVARQYVAQFYPAYEYQNTLIETEIVGGLFIAKAKTPLVDGWKVLFSKSCKPKSIIDNDDDLIEQLLPAVIADEIGACQNSTMVSKTTTPPKSFDDASLLAAMTGIARYVESADIRKVLNDTDGLGTEATRAGIIELLFKREFLVRRGKHIEASEAGRQLINALPKELTVPDMTAQWEMQLTGISQKKLAYQTFMQPLEQQLTNLVIESQQLNMQGFKGLSAPRSAYKKKRKSSANANNTWSKKSAGPRRKSA